MFKLRTPARNTQPQGAARIDRSNPFATGLVNAILPHGNTMVDVVGGSTFTPVATPTYDVIPGCRALKTVAGSSQYGYFTTSVTSWPYTVLTVHIVDATTAMAHVSLGTASGTDRSVLFYGSVAGSYTASILPNGGGTDAALAAGTGGVTVAGLRVASASSASVFANGFVATGTTTPQAQALSRLYIGARMNSTAGSFASQRNSLVLVWNRALSDAEIDRISDNPWQVFSQNSLAAYVAGGLGGGANGTATITGVSATGSAGTIAGSGSASVSIAGVGSAGSTGTLTATGSAIAPMVGVSATSAIGSISANGDASTALTGVAGTGSAGTITATGSGSGTAVIVGVQATGSAGTIVATGSGAGTANISGVAATGSAGSIVGNGSAAAVLTGVSATGAAGVISASAGTNGTATLTGVWATAAVGQLIATGMANALITGAQARGYAGDFFQSAALHQSLKRTVALSGRTFVVATPSRVLAVIKPANSTVAPYDPSETGS